MAPKSKSKSKASKSVSETLNKCELSLNQSKGGHNTIVAFPNPTPASSVRFTIEDSERELVVRGKSKSCSYENVRKKRLSAKSKKSRKRKANAAGAGASDGASDGEDSDSDGGSALGGDSMMTTMTAVYNKETKQVTLHYGKGVNMIAPLSQSIDKYNPIVKDNALEEHSYAARRDALYASFGSSKKLKVLKSQKANEVKIR
jgi:hypothetical protein